MDRREFSKSVGLFAGYIAIGGGAGNAAQKLIVTPEEYMKEAQEIHNMTGAILAGQVSAVAVLDSKGQIRGTTEFVGGPRWLDHNDTLEVTAHGEILCTRCGNQKTITTIDRQQWRCM